MENAARRKVFYCHRITAQSKFFIHTERSAEYVFSSTQNAAQSMFFHSHRIQCSCRNNPVRIIPVAAPPMWACQAIPGMKLIARLMQMVIRMLCRLQ